MRAVNVRFRRQVDQENAAVEGVRAAALEQEGRIARQINIASAFAGTVACKRRRRVVTGERDPLTGFDRPGDPLGAVVLENKRTGREIHRSNRNDDAGVAVRGRVVAEGENRVFGLPLHLDVRVRVDRAAVVVQGRIVVKSDRLAFYQDFAA